MNPRLIGALILLAVLACFLILRESSDPDEGAPIAPAVTPESAHSSFPAEAAGVGRELVKAPYGVKAPPGWLIDGRVVRPAGTPAEVALAVRARAGGLDELVEVEDDRFGVQLPLDAEVVELELVASFLFLDAPIEVRRPEDHRQPVAVTLAPNLGAHLSVRLVAPATLARESLDAAEVVLRGRDAEGSRPVRAANLGGGRFEVAALPADRLWSVDADGPEFVRAWRQGLRVFAGRREELEVALQQGARVAGHVLDADGESARGVEVIARYPNPIPTAITAWIEGGTTATDEAGEFGASGLPPGELRLEARVEGAQPARLELGVVADGELREGLVLRLERGERVSGRVLWPDGRAAVAAKVHAMPMANPWAAAEVVTTDADGRFELGGLAGEAFAVLASGERGDGSLWRARIDDVPAGSTGVTLTLEAGERVVGRVRDDEGRPLERFTVVARPLDDALGVRSKGERREQFEDSEGVFELVGVGAGAWDVRAEADGHAGSSWRRVVMPDGAGELHLVVHRLASLVGRVVDPNGVPIDAAEVTVGSPGGGRAKASSNETGIFHVDEVAPGALELVASAADRRASAPLELAVAPGETREGLELVLRVGARLEGEVDPSVTDFARRKVLLMPEDAYTTKDTLCDEEGRFAFEGLEPGRWTVMFDWQPTGGGGADWIEGFGRRSAEPVELFEDETSYVVLGRPRPDAVRLTGRVLRGGEPSPGYLVYVFPTENTTDKPSAMPLTIARSDEEGTYSLELREPGAYRFSVGPDTTFQVRFFRDVPAGPEARLDFELPATVLGGTVVKADGSPAARHPVMLVCADAPPSSRAFGDVHASGTDADGRFRYEGLQPGDYILRVGGWTADTKGLGVRVVSGIHLEAGEERTDLLVELSAAAVIEGGVIGADGRPAQGVRVQVLDPAGQSLYVWRDVETDYTGAFRFPNVGAGELRVVAEAEDGARAELDVQVEPGRVMRVVLDL